MMMGLRGLGVAGLFVAAGALAGCAEDVGPEGDVDPAAVDAVESVSAPEGFTINCGQTIPGWPSPPCLPDLVVTQAATQVVAPGGNIAPGYYIQFIIKNDSLKDAGAFAVRVNDQLGATLKTYSFAGLAAGASSSIIVYAPWDCGWSRKVTVDSANQVSEADESNNTATSSYLCKRY